MADNRIIETEGAVIGSMLIAPEICGELFAQVSADDFLTPEYKHIFLSARELFFLDKHVDAVTIREKAGGEEYRKILMDLIDITPTATAWKEYAELLKKESRLCKIRDIGKDLYACASLENANKLLSDAQKLTSLNVTNATDIKTGLLNFFIDLDKPVNYYKTGIHQLDNKLNISAGDFIIIGGYPSAGKTAFALQIAGNMSFDRKVCIFSLETSTKKIYERIITQQTLSNYSNIKNKKLSEAELMQITKQKDKLNKMQISVVDAAGMSVQDIIAQALANRYDVIFVDYLQLIRPDSNQNRHEQVAQISRDLHTFAQKHKITVIALSQLSRPEKQERVQKAPTMSSLRESGQLEQDADAILLLYLAEPDNPFSDRIAKLVKNKDGALVYIRLDFDGLKQLFIEYMEDVEKLSPIIKK